MVKVSLPIDKYYGAHLRLEYRHCSSKSPVANIIQNQSLKPKLKPILFSLAKDKTEKRLLGFSFTPLMDRDGTVLPDGQQQLLVYKTEDVTRLKDPSVYLQLPYSCKQVNSLAQAVSMPTLVPNVATSMVGAPLFQRGRESVTVSFYLCSTKLTQNGYNSISFNILA